MSGKTSGLSSSENAIKAKFSTSSEPLVTITSSGDTEYSSAIFFLSRKFSGSEYSCKRLLSSSTAAVTDSDGENGDSLVLSFMYCISFGCSPGVYGVSAEYFLLKNLLIFSPQNVLLRSLHGRKVPLFRRNMPPYRQRPRVHPLNNK